jgi:hypothetical protein
MSYDDWKTATPPEYDGQLSETGHLRARIRMLETERDAEHDRRVKLEGRIAAMEVASANARDVEAALREVKFYRELAHDRLVAALREGAPDLSALLDTIVECLDHELPRLDEPWEDLPERGRKHVAGNVLQAIALDLAEKKS